MVRTVAVAAVACALASCGPSAGTTVTAPNKHDDPDAPKRAPYIVSESPGIALTATDARYLYWIDDAGLKRRPHGDAEVQAELVTDKFTTDYGALLVVGDRAYHFSDAVVTSVKIDVKGAEPETIATLPSAVDAFTVSPTGDVYVGVGGQVLQVELGKEPRVVASGVGVINDVVSDDGFIYIAVEDGVAASAPPPPPSPYYAPPAPLPGRGSLHKVAHTGGKVIDLAADQAMPEALAVSDGRLYWVSPNGPAVSSVPIGGGDVRVEAPGHGEALAVDAGGVVYRQGNTSYSSGGMVVENRAGARQVAFVPDGTWNVDSQGAIALSPDWIYLTATRTATYVSGILALPRQIQAIQIPFAMDRMLYHLDLEDDALYWYEVERDSYDGHNHIMRGDPMTGEHRELADFEGTISELVAGAGQVYFHDGYTISQVAVAGGEVRTFDRVDTWVTGLQVHRNHVYWFDGSSIYARKRRGGTAFQIARNDQYYGYGYGYDSNGGDMVFDDDFVYTTGFGQGGTGLFQISERGQIKVLWGAAGGSIYPGKDLVLLGDELFFIAGQGSGSVTVMKVTTDGEADQLYAGRGDGYGVDLIQGGGMLYFQQNTGESYELTRLDPSTGEAQTVFRIYPAGDYPTMDADDRAVYFGMNGYDAIFRIPHDAPAVPEVGWAPASE